ncbi:hypothetical protein [Paraburkholderia solisilvae]|uniref:Uncharacterized protein n=1 Tax=Paraburkholderia solisilvae TaxID=624376 RepID=A0A6J5DQ48_9BURK|nr:hypothetical protein [Paraburkholderia solisilvae]CAB3756128.1 hypothetical protein LMG29739_02388 [Paraburkholderia solisilvae]
MFIGHSAHRLCGSVTQVHQVQVHQVQVHHVQAGIGVSRIEWLTHMAGNASVKGRRG